MATTVEIIVAPLQHAAVPFDAVVVVTGAPPGTRVSATLEQKSGLPPLWGPETQEQVAHASGSLSFPFTVTLNGPAQATLVATVKDRKGTFYPSDVKDVQVVGGAGLQ
jgi:hypothetical protein